jgi:hypothetical protein
MVIRSLLPAAFLAIAFLALTGCPDGGDKADKDSKASQSADEGDKADPSVPPADWPTEPLDVGAAPVTGPERLPTDLTLEDVGGTATTLGDLLAGNSLVVYMNTDTNDRQNRAATRLLRKLVKSGGPAGFRLIVIFTEGSTRDEIDNWYRRRQVARIGKTAIDAQGHFAAQVGWEPRSAALVGPDGQIGPRFGPTEEWDSRLGFDGGLNSDLLSLAWKSEEQAPEVSAATKQAAVDLVKAVLAAPPVEGALPAVSLDGPGLADPVIAPVYVSLYRLGFVRRLRGTAAEGTLGEALASATLDALSSAGDGAAGWREDAAQLRFAIDIAAPGVELPSRDPLVLWYLVEPGVDGIIARKGDKEGVVLPHEAVTQGYMTPRVRGRTKKWEATIKEGCRRGNIGVGEWASDAVNLFRFRTTSFGVNLPGSTQAIDMFRGNVLIDGPPDEAAILESIRLGGLWLVNTVMEDGKFDYEYFPNRDKGSPGYNIVRHAGSVYGLFEMYHLALEEKALSADQAKYIDAAARSIGYIYEATEVPAKDETGKRRCLISQRTCDSGSAALTLLTFLRRPPRDELPAKYRDVIYRDGDDELMEGLGLTLLDMIDDQGRVFARYSQAMTMDAVKKEPLYYPGETMLALMAFYEHSGDERWLAGAKAIGDRQSQFYKAKRFTWPDHWIMQALYPLWKATKDDFYAQTAYSMATHSIAEQYPTVWSPYPDYHGAWRRTKDLPRTTRAGSRLEAIRGVVHLAWEAGEDATVWEDGLIAAADHLIEKQYRADNVWYLPNPAKVQGAYPMGIVDNHIRIDNNQHALVGMLGALESLRRRAKSE